MDIEGGKVENGKTVGTGRGCCKLGRKVATCIWWRIKPRRKEKDEGGRKKGGRKGEKERVRLIGR